MNVDLTGQTAVVTGASRGIGLAVTRALAASGARVVAGALHSSAELGKLAAEGSVTIGELDLAAPGGPADLVALAGSRIDILVNNVGGAPPRVAATVGHATGARPEDVASGAASEMVTGRFSRPEEVADLVLLLASDRTGNVTGADFVIDGGLITTL